MSYSELEQALSRDRSRANLDHGPGAWDVADVMQVLQDQGINVRDRDPEYDDLATIDAGLQLILLACVTVLLVLVLL